MRMAQVLTLPSAPSERRSPPGPRGHWLLGHAREIQHEALDFYLQLARDYGDVARVRLLTNTVYMVSHPDGIRRVLQKNHLDYDRNAFVYKPLRLFFGDGLISSDGAVWRQQRRLVQPVFHQQRINGLATQMTDAATIMLSRWENRANQDEPLDMHQEMRRITLYVAGMTLFGIDLSDEDNPVGQAFQTMIHALGSYVFFPFPPLFVPTPRNRSIQQALRTLNGLVEDLVRQRRAQSTDPGDLLSLLLQMRDDTGQGMSEKLLYDEIISLLFGGFETTSNTLTWVLYLLARHPECEQRFWDELDTVLHGQRPTLEHVSQLCYTRMIIDEALRLYPPSIGLVRRTRVDDTIGGYRIPANHMVWCNIYATHRNPEYWENQKFFILNVFLQIIQIRAHTKHIFLLAVDHTFA